MSDAVSRHEGKWPSARRILQYALCVGLLVVIYVLSQGPAAHFHNRNIRAGGAGFAGTMSVVYAPAQRLQPWIPYFQDWMNWWIEP